MVRRYFQSSQPIPPDMQDLSNFSASTIFMSPTTPAKLNGTLQQTRRTRRRSQHNSPRHTEYTLRTMEPLRAHLWTLTRTESPIRPECRYSTESSSIRQTAQRTALMVEMHLLWRGFSQPRSLPPPACSLRSIKGR